MSWTTIPGTSLANALDRINDIAVIGEHAWAVSAGGRLFRWGADQNVVQTALGGHARCVGFASDASTGWIGFLPGGGHTTRLKKTTDGGHSWQKVDALPLDPAEGFCGLRVLDATHAYACGTFKNLTRPGLARTVDGSQWSSILLPASLVCLTDLHLWDADRLLVVGGAGAAHRSPAIHLTCDGGQRWRSARLPDDLPPDCIAWKVFFLDELTGFVSVSQRTQPDGGASASILATDDGGLQWRTIQVAAAGTWDVQGVGFLDRAHGWAGNRNGVTWQTTDGGAHWSPDPLPTNLNRLLLTSDAIFATGSAVYVRSLSNTNTPSVRSQCAGSRTPS